MLYLAFGILTAAALVGAGLAVHYARGAARRRPHGAILSSHAALGATGLLLLLAALRGGLPESNAGTSGFGVIAASLFAVTLALGIAITFARRRGRRPAGILVAAHASIAIAGVVVLIALVTLG